MGKMQLIAPASGLPDLSEQKFVYLKKFLQKHGMDLRCSQHIFKSPRSFLSAPDEVRLDDLEQSFIDPSVECILALRGGYGSAHLLDKLNYTKIKKHQKPLFGFSDITALQNALWQKIKMVSFSGFIGWYALPKIPPKLQKSLESCLNNQEQKVKIKKIVSGKDQGVLLGGNLSVFLSLLGTPYFPNMKDKILILEEVHEPPKKIDRMLNQLKQAGVFKNLKGLILGDLSALVKPNEKKEISKILMDYFKESPYPVVYLKEYSHAQPSIVVPIGGTVRLDTQKGILTLDKIKKIQ